MRIPFKQNMGPLDRVLRICLGIVPAILALSVVSGTVATILLILSIPLLIPGITGSCPLYTLLGISTKREARCC